MGVILERTARGPLDAAYKHPKYNDYYIEAHAKPNCRSCRGRGKLNFDNPRTGEAWVEACDCVFRK